MNSDDGFGYAASSVEAFTLINKLIDPNYQIRESAACMFRDAGKDALPYLHRALTVDHPGIRWEAVKILSDMNTTDALPLLISALSDEVSSIRWMAAQGLRSFTEAGILAVLQRLTVLPKADISPRLLLLILEQPHLSAFSVLKPVISSLIRTNLTWPGPLINQVYHEYEHQVSRNAHIENYGGCQC